MTNKIYFANYSKVKQWQEEVLIRVNWSKTVKSQQFNGESGLTEYLNLDLASSKGEADFWTMFTRGFCAPVVQAINKDYQIQ